MRIRLTAAKIAAAALVVTLGATLGGTAAEARGHTAGASSHSYRSAGLRGHLHSRFASYSSLQCVPFARENTGIELSGNAANWWNNADGVYQRGARPEVGSVLNFRANGRMRMGHVAVVSNVVDARNIEIDHANWAGPGASRGGVSRNIIVVDVSPNNDWTAVRVALGHTGEFGSVYPTFGFIYDRPDNGTLLANNSHAPAPVLNAAPRDLRPAAERLEFATAAQESEEVAEAADDATPRFRRVGRHGHLMRATVRGGFSRTAGLAQSRSTSSHGTASHAMASRSMGQVAVARVQSHSAVPAHHAARHRT